MAKGPALDTDVLLKVAAYRLAAELVQVLGRYGCPAVLGLTHLIADRQLARKRGLRDPHGAAKELARLLATMGRLEPNEAEIALAADLAARAQELSLPLDSGEAQLVAITATRELPLLLTGDKRALRALGSMLTNWTERAALVGRLACFEQVVATMARIVGDGELRDRICAEPDVDGAMRLACSCGKDDWDPAQLCEACDSFVGVVRADTGNLLTEGLLLA